MLVGYSRVSTADQNLDLQRDALTKAQCERVFEEAASGAKADRPILAECIAFLRPGDTLVVWRLDRLARSLKDLIGIVDDLERRQIGFLSVTESIDTTTHGGRLVFHIFGALAQFERDLIRERTNAGLSAARARGRKGGRPKKLTGEKLAMARAMSQQHEIPINEICRTLGVSRSTLYEALHEKHGVV
jgi:DNA invertase Pin-like site-specific DNA recombinase